ncbi:MAG: hypothetical protein ABI549_09330 [Flavobacterium sp.]|uniref:hypothetical protein n=1 Tax=Flavobacterium sp. TaxID=239 RepID=UPI0032664292
MKKIILLLSVLILALTSCSKNEDEPVVPIDQSVNILLKRTVTTRGSVVTTDVYSYNERKIDKIVSNDGIINSETRFTYTGDLITKIEVYSNTVLKSKKEYSYQNDKMTQIITYDYNGTQTTKKRMNYVHDVVNVNQERAHYEIHSINMSNSQETLYTDGDIYFSGREITSQLNTDYPVVSGRLIDSWSEYSHDFKKNPTINIIGYNKLLDNVDGTSTANIANKKLTADAYVNGVWGTEITNYKRTYKYNDLLFPYERKIFTKNVTLDNTTQYFYE